MRYVRGTVSKSEPREYNEIITPIDRITTCSKGCKNGKAPFFRSSPVLSVGLARVRVFARLYIQFCTLILTHVKVLKRGKSDNYNWRGKFGKRSEVVTNEESLVQIKINVTFLCPMWRTVYIKLSVFGCPRC